ncbi:hypothetical protein ACWGB8_02125 [Kitasatospora sp. NPDC054939]
MKPSALPKVRDQVVRHLADPAMPIRAATSPGVQPDLDAELSRLQAAELYWVSADMAALAMSAGSQLAAARWATADRPAPCGLMVFDGGIGTYSDGPVEIPVEAISWGPSSGGLSIGLWLSRSLLEQRVRENGRFLGIENDQVPPLVPTAGRHLPVGAEPVPFAEIGPDSVQPIVQALAAAWLLVQQPTLVDRRQERADKPTARAYGRLGKPSPQVNLVDLRRAYAPDQRVETGQHGGHHYRHRWVVQGHWRDQPFGPERAQRRKQWIPAHIKGPDGAPLLATERVNVWRR